MPQVRRTGHGAALHPGNQLFVHRSHHLCRNAGRASPDFRFLHGGFKRGDADKPGVEIHKEDYHAADIRHRSHPHRNEPDKGRNHSLRRRSHGTGGRQLRQFPPCGPCSGGTAAYHRLQPEFQPLPAHEFHRHRTGDRLHRSLVHGHHRLLLDTKLRRLQPADAFPLRTGLRPVHHHCPGTYFHDYRHRGIRRHHRQLPYLRRTGGRRHFRKARFGRYPCRRLQLHAGGCAQFLPQLRLCARTTE